MDNDKIVALAKQVATSNFGVEVSSGGHSPIVDLSGDDALEITLVVPSESATKVPGATLKTLVQVHDAMLAEGDRRFPFIRYATLADLNSPADLEDEP